MAIPRQFAQGNIWATAKQNAVYGTLIRQVTVTLTNAQFMALTTTPQTLITTPGTNKASIVHAIVLNAHFVTPYAGDADWDTLFVCYDSNTFLQVASLFNGESGENYLNRFLTNSEGATDHLTRLIIPQSSWAANYGEIGPSNIARTFPTDKSVTMKATIAGTLTGGNTANTLVVSILYSILDVTTGLFV